MPATGSVRYTDTLLFIRTIFKFPEITSEDYLRQSVGDILALLQDPPKILPFLAYGNNTKNAITKIAHLIQRSVTQPRLPLIPVTPLGSHTTQPVPALSRLPMVLPSTVASPRVKSTVPSLRVHDYAPVQPTPPLSTRIL